MYENITPAVLKQRIFDALTTDIDKDEGSFANDIVAPTALEIWKIYAMLDALVAIVYPDETSGEYIDKKCSYYGTTRKQGTKATVTLTITGTSGTVVPKGTTFLNAENLQFTTDAAATLSSGTASVAATAFAVGTQYNVAASTITRQLASLSGVSTVTNAAAASGGTEPETDAALLARLYARMQQPATSGNAYHYKQWALEVSGVGAAKVVPLWNGAGTVKVLIASAGMGPVDNTVVAAAQTHIDEERPIGATVTVATVTGLDINISATVSVDSSTTLAAVKTAFEAALEKYLQSISFDKYTVPYSRIGYLLAGTDGVTDYSNLTVNSGTSNITVESTQVPQKGTVTLSAAT